MNILFQLGNQVVPLGLRSRPDKTEILRSDEDRSAQDDTVLSIERRIPALPDSGNFQIAATTKKVIQQLILIQARAMVAPQVKPIPADANSNNCPGRISPALRIFT